LVARPRVIDMDMARHPQANPEDRVLLAQ
jgi:hypothetical protein